MRSKKTIIIAAAILAAALLLTAGGILVYYLKNQFANVTFSARPQAETPEYLNTPECGWYQLYAYRLKPDTMLAESELYLQENDSDGIPYRLALLEFNLSDYKSCELDYFAQENIKKVLERFKKTKAKVILRFLYDWDGNGRENEPDVIPIIKRHMEQTGKIINSYRKMVYTTQGIFVGSWGEMHDSRFLSVEDMTDLLLYYASVTDDSVYLSVRTPNQYRDILTELEQHKSRYEEYGINRKKLIARLGLFNDGMLGSVSDTGTYHAADTAPSIQAGKEIRAKEIAFQNNVCLNVPNGGEAVKDNPYNDWENAIADMRQMRISYLNQIYDEAVIKKWRESTYSGNDTLYDGISAYEYIAKHLGYRFVLRDTKIDYRPDKNATARGTVTVENVGFASMYHTKKLSVEMINRETGKRISVFSTKDKNDRQHPCHWAPGETSRLSFEFDPLELEEGEYTLLLYMTDLDSREFIHFANDSFDRKLNGYLLGTVKIEHH